MWHIHTSMRPVALRVLAVAAVVVAVAAGFAGGWWARGPSSSSASAGPEVLSVAAAGSLAPILPAILDGFAAATPGVETPVAAQLYEGSSAAASALTLPGAPYDLFVSADFRVAPRLLEPPNGSVASWEIVFASDPLVLAYAPGAVGLGGINASNWYEKLVGPGVTLGTPNASVDPLGANAIFALELTDGLTGQGGAFYGHFFRGAEGAFASPTAATKYVAENVAATALSTHEVSAYLTYRSYAVANGLSFVPLNASVDLGGIDAASVAGYASARTTVLVGSGTEVVSGAPALFALTVPRDAPEYAVGVEAAAFLVSNASRATWVANGFEPLAPMWADRPAALPALLTGTAPGAVEPLPPYLAALLG